MISALAQYYVLGFVLLPLLPVLYFQGQRVRAMVPKLSEATEPSGVVGKGGIPFRLLVFGESTMAGVGVDTHRHGFTGALAQSLSGQLSRQIEWQVIARSGFTARKVANILVPQFSGKSPDLIVVGLGGNDAFKLVNPVSWRKSIRMLINSIRLRHPESPVVFTAMPPIGEFPAFPRLMQRMIGGWVHTLGRILEHEVLKHENVFFQQPEVRVSDWLSLEDEPLKVDDFFSDGVHPSPIAYRLWGKALGTFIVEKGL